MDCPPETFRWQSEAVRNKIGFGLKGFSTATLAPLIGWMFTSSGTAIHFDLMKASLLFFVLMTTSLVGLTAGCGSEENAVITREEDYQLTEQEQINRDLEQQAR